MRVETVKVQVDNEQGFVLINKSDVTDDHKLYIGSKPEPKQGKTPKPRKKKSQGVEDNAE